VEIQQIKPNQTNNNEDLKDLKRFERFLAAGDSKKNCAAKIFSILFILLRLNIKLQQILKDSKRKACASKNLFQSFPICRSLKPRRRRK